MSIAAELVRDPSRSHLLGIKKIYLSGGMTGRPQFNYPAFNEAAANLREDGFEVYNPTERPMADGQCLDTSAMTGFEKAEDIGLDPRAAFAEYAAYITTTADAVAVLPGWESSRGARGEVALALAFGLPVIDALTLNLLRPEFTVNTHVVSDPVPLSAPAAQQASPALKIVHDTKDAEAAPATYQPKPGETRVTSATGGQKGQKDARHSLIPTGPLHELAVLFGRGNEKYPPERSELANWKRGYDWSLSYDALRRHLDLWWSGEDHDEEMQVKHIINVAWHAFVIAWFMENRREYDDRPATVARALGKPEVYRGALPIPQWIFDLREDRAREAAGE